MKLPSSSSPRTKTEARNVVQPSTPPVLASDVLLAGGAGGEGGGGSATGGGPPFNLHPTGCRCKGSNDSGGAGDGRSTARHLPFTSNYSSSRTSSRATSGGAGRGLVLETERRAASAAEGESADRFGPEGSEVWSMSSRGMTPLGALFGGAGTGEWGLGSSGVAPGSRATGSQFGLAGGDAAVLERRAEAAHEQSEFWEHRARAAEERNRGLEIVRSIW